ncbi:Wzz/FepE/Etk N-terminal domain-containing protein [Pseudoalteromonas sp. Z9A4]|uniref:Wzz/FepE/Etk N-terminal domain-containing protein n=1 Tax=Pseudoalteromonas sp. Z9A4 TaxID=2686353 RepID=UPI00140DC250|nr:Wzz/FepE/Etk N-terminal domain-containing protein [Pseudoalteromonas sp. Z9A4]
MENNLNNPKQTSEHTVADEEIDLRELFTAIWQGKWIIIAITTLFAVASVFYAINQPNIYKSEALLAPAEEQQGGGLGALAGQFGGLAGLAGVDIGGGGDKTQLALEILKSRKFTSNFIEKHSILPDLMAVESWDLATGSLTYDTDVYNPDTNTWLREAKAPKKAEPSMQEAYKVFSKIIDTNTDPETSTITLSVAHISPVIAQQWVNWLIEDINIEVKQRDVSEAIKSTEFLTQQLEKTKVSDIRSVLYNLVEEQTKTIMFANVRDEYVFKTIDPAIIPEERFKPRRAIICIAGTFLGIILSFFFLVLRFFLKRS